MNTRDRDEMRQLRRENALLRAQLSTAVDKQLLLLNQVIDLKDENAQLRAKATAMRAEISLRTGVPVDQVWRDEGFDQWKEQRRA